MVVGQIRAACLLFAEPDSGSQGNFGFAKANISANNPIHRPCFCQSF
jgi:hypothetical protein